MLTRLLGTRRRKIIAAISVVAVLAGTAGGAYAFYHGSSGTATATTKQVADATIAITEPAAEAGQLVPGGSEPVNVLLTDLSNFGYDWSGLPIVVDSVICTVGGAQQTTPVAPDPSWFTVSNLPGAPGSNTVSIGGANPQGHTWSGTGAVTLSYVNTATDQDACSGATISLSVHVVTP